MTENSQFLRVDRETYLPPAYLERRAEPEIYKRSCRMSKHLQRTASGRFFEYMASSLCLPALFSERAGFLYYECRIG